MARRLFIGLSTQEIQGRRGWTVTDIELVKRDLLNHFSTRRGERVMLPNYGTIIWDLLFEPFTDGVRQAIVDDATRIVNLDSRVQIENINVISSVNGITVAMGLQYVPWDSFGNFSVEFDRRSVERL